jgi:hypothetical protein
MSDARKTIVFYGNCQAQFMRDLLVCDPALTAEFRILYVASFVDPTGADPAPTRQDFADCALLCEQLDWKPFPDRDKLAPDCPIVRFPPLDSLLLWPFNCPNPYNEPEPPVYPWGRFACGDRILLKEIDAGKEAGAILDYYLTGWSQYRVDLKRMQQLERSRLSKRDETCDVRSSDLVLDKLASERLFWNIGHPTKPLVAQLTSRLLGACAPHIPTLAAVDVDGLIRDHPDVGAFLEAVEVPVHPEVAAALDLRWYDPDARYVQYGGQHYSYVEYFDAFIRYGIAKRARHQQGIMTIAEVGPDWTPPLSGPVSCSGITGYFPDGFMGGELRFDLLASKPISALAVKGFCPQQHEGPVTLTCSIGSSSPASVEASPGAMFALECPAALTSGQRHQFALHSSRIMNLWDRGESEDGRDLSVIVLSIEAR